MTRWKPKLETVARQRPPRACRNDACGGGAARAAPRCCGARRGRRGRESRGRGRAHLPTQPSFTRCPSARYLGSVLRTTSSSASSKGPRYSAGDVNRLRRRVSDRPGLSPPAPSPPSTARAARPAAAAPLGEVRVEGAEVVQLHQQARLLARHHVLQPQHLVAVPMLRRRRRSAHETRAAANRSRLTHVAVQKVSEATLQNQALLRAGVHRSSVRASRTVGVGPARCALKFMLRATHSRHFRQHEATSARRGSAMYTTDRSIVSLVKFFLTR